MEDRRASDLATRAAMHAALGEPARLAIVDDLAKLLAKTSMIHRNQARLLVTLLTAISKSPLEEAKEIALAEREVPYGPWLCLGAYFWIVFFI